MLGALYQTGDKFQRTAFKLPEPFLVNFPRFGFIVVYFDPGIAPMKSPHIGGFSFTDFQCVGRFYK